MRLLGIENFSFTIIEECEEALLDEREQYWIWFYDSYRNGYNETDGGRFPKNKSGVAIELYTLEGEYVSTYPSITEAASAIGVSRNCLYQVVYGHRLSARGFQFRRVGDTRPITKYTNRQGGKIKIKQIDPKTEACIRVWESSYDAARVLGVDSSSISKCLNGKLRSTGGFQWARA